MSLPVRVWDLPTRLFHWALALCVLGLFATAWFGSEDLVWHFRFGYATLSLLLFRLVWGVIGGHWSRFASFLYRPSTLWRDLRGQSTPEERVGHSPTAALSVFAMLVLLLVQVGTGLISDDEVSATGPLAAKVSNALVSQATFYHAEIGQLILLVLVVLHVAAIAFYLRVKHVNLVRPMVMGDKAVDTPVPASRDDARTRWLALAVYGACLGLVLLLLKLSA